MTAGSGIVAPNERRTTCGPGALRCSGCRPGWPCRRPTRRRRPHSQHAAAAALPVVAPLRVVLIAGTGWQRRSPVRVFSPTLYAEATLAAGAALTVPADHAERAVRAAAGAVEIAGAEVTPGPLVVLGAGAREVRARKAARLVVISRRAAGRDRLLWWRLHSPASRADGPGQAELEQR